MANKSSKNENEEVNVNPEVTANNVTQSTGENTANNAAETEKKSAAPVKKQEKVKIVIPKDPINKNDSFVPVAINGYIYQIKRGETVEVPKEVARILKEAGYIA